MTRSATPGMRRIVIPIALVACALYLPKTLWPHSRFYVEILGPLRLQMVGAFAKLACMGTAAFYGLRSGARLERGNPARLPWFFIGTWIGLWAIGEIILIDYALGLSTSSLPSPADILFLVGYIFLFVAEVRFVLVYRASGFPVGSARTHLALAGGSLAVLGALSFVLLAPTWHAATTLAERILNTAYPIMDLTALVPTIVMIHIAMAFRPGKVWVVWAALLMGFSFIAIGDFMTAYLGTSDAVAFDPGIHLTYFLGYLAIACGAKLQYELLTDAD